MLRIGDDAAVLQVGVWGVGDSGLTARLATYRYDLKIANQAVMFQVSAGVFTGCYGRM